MKKILLCLMLIASLLVSACSNSNSHEAGHEEEKYNQDPSLGDIRQETSSNEVAPDFLKNKPEEMQLIYMAVAKNQELLEKIPCYCGCGDSVGHKDNYDCFIHDNKGNGAVVWDDHGTKCGVCLDIAAQSILDYKNGKSIKEIRDEIDEKYKEGYATPTPTPEV